MGMLLTNLSFAEQIIEKYSSMESYYFDDDLLVFYRESLAASAGASSAYYTELALKLLFTFQNYQQSGQHLNLNWNLLSQTILNQAAAVSKETERILRPVIQKSQNQMVKQMERAVNEAVNEAADKAANQTEEILLKRWLETGQMTDVQAAESRTAGIRPADVQASESRAAEKQKEERKKWLEEVLSSAKVTESQKELLKELFASVQGTEAQRERWREVLAQAEKAGYASTMAEIQNQTGWVYQDSETDIEKAVEGLRQEIAGSQIRQAGKKNRPFLGGIGTAKMRLWLFKEQEKKISQVHVEEWIRQMSPEDQALVWESLVQSAEEFVHVIPGGERLRERIQQLEKSSYTKRSGAGQSGREYGNANRDGADSGRTKQGSTGYGSAEQGGQEYESGGSVSSSLAVLAAQSPEDIYQFIRWIVSGDSGISDIGSRESDWTRKGRRLSGNRSAEIIVNLFRKYEDTVFQKTEETRTRTERRRIENMALFSDMITILGNRSIEPGRAKAAEKELRDILIHDLLLEETHLVWKTEPGKQSVQEKEERLQTFVNLLETPKVMATIHRRIEETDEKGKERLKEWVRKYQISNSEKEFEKEKKELLTQIRAVLGTDAARTLEHYFVSRERNADHGTRYETIRQIDETVKHIINSYVNVTRKENIADTLGGGKSLYLNNRMREKVHEPSSGQAVRGKRNLDVVVDMVQRDYQFRQERTLLLEKIQERIRTTARDRLLGEKTGNLIEHAETRDSQSGLHARQGLRENLQLRSYVRQELRGNQQPGSHIRQELRGNQQPGSHIRQGLRGNLWLEPRALQVLRGNLQPESQTLQVLRENLKLGLYAQQKLRENLQSGLYAQQELRGNLQPESYAQQELRGNLQPGSYARQEPGGNQQPGSYARQELRGKNPPPGSRAWQEAGESWQIKRERLKAAPEGQWEEVQTQFLRRQRTQESQMEETKKMVRVLKEKIEVQEKVMTELKRNTGQNKIPAQVNINQLTKQVMKKMEEELRVEKMRRGLL